MVKMILKRLKSLDYPLIIVFLLLCTFGLIMVYSASYPLGIVNYQNATYFFFKQLQWLLVGLVFFFIAVLLPYRIYGRLSPFLVVLSISLLLIVLLPGIGVERNHSQRWIQLGSFVIQPSEAVKLAMVVYFAYIYEKKQMYLHNFKEGVLPPLVMLGIVFLLILKQPDLGTATSILLTCGVMLLCSGVRKSHLVILSGVAITSVSYLAITEPYRLKRLVSFRNPFEDPLGDGYQLVQSYYAITSGGLSGKGLGNSTQKFGDLPEAHTDFIMAIILEEIGFLGLLFVMVLYVFIMLRGFSTASRLNATFPRLLAIGVTFQIMIQVVFNLGAVSGLLPITGITLPFVSYGGSSLVFMMISAGILVNVSSSLNRLK